MKINLETFQKFNIVKQIVILYSIYLILSLGSAIVFLFSDSLYKIVYVFVSIFVLYLTLEIYYCFELKRQRLYFFSTIILCPIIYLLNKDGDILLGFVGNVLGLYFFATNLFIVSFAGLTMSFVTLSKKVKYLVILILSFILSFLFISGDAYRFYSKPQLIISTENDVRVTPQEKNGKLLVNLPDLNALVSFKLNPFYPDIIVGSDEGCGCSYWKTGNENEKDFWRQNTGSDVINKFDENSFSKEQFYRLLISNATDTVTLTVQDGNTRNESYYNKVTISGGYIRPGIYEYNDHLQKDYYSRSLKLFTYQNIFVYIYQMIYDISFKESNKREVIHILDESIKKIIKVN